MAIRLLRQIRVTVIFGLGMACGVIGFSNDPANIPPEELKKSELTYHVRTVPLADPRLLIRKETPYMWTPEIHDVFAIHGAFALNGLQIWPHEGQCLLVDTLYLSKTRESLERNLQKR